MTGGGDKGRFAERERRDPETARWEREILLGGNEMTVRRTRENLASAKLMM